MRNEELIKKSKEREEKIGRIRQRLSYRYSLSEDIQTKKPTLKISTDHCSMDLEDFIKSSDIMNTIKLLINQQLDKEIKFLETELLKELGVSSND